MVVPTEVLTRCPVQTGSGVAGYKDGGVRDLAPPTPAGPLNATAGFKSSLSPQCNLEGRSTPKGGRVSPALGVPVVSVDAHDPPTSEKKETPQFLPTLADGVSLEGFR